MVYHHPHEISRVFRVRGWALGRDRFYLNFDPGGMLFLFLVMIGWEA